LLRKLKSLSPRCDIETYKWVAKITWPLIWQIQGQLIQMYVRSLRFRHIIQSYFPVLNYAQAHWTPTSQQHQYQYRNDSIALYNLFQFIRRIVLKPIASRFNIGGYWASKACRNLTLWSQLLHKSTKSDQLSSSLPILRRLLKHHVLVGLSLPQLQKGISIIQRKHFL
jgi:hypothetical protein